MGNPKDDKKKMDAAKKEVRAEVKKVSLQMRKSVKKLEDLKNTKSEIDAKKSKSPDDKKEVKMLNLRIKKEYGQCNKFVGDCNRRIDLVLKKNTPDDKKEKAAAQKSLKKILVDAVKGNPIKISGKYFTKVNISGDLMKLELESVVGIFGRKF